ncbi:MAG: hypothetical protein ACJ76H_15690 [Bacteriovoracaceae bacterium]
MKKYTRYIGPVVLSAALAQLIACGGGSSSRGAGSKSGESPRILESDADGTYVSNLDTMNNGVGGAISAIASFNKEGDRLMAFLRFNGGYPGIAHQQRVHVGTRCPTMADDTNGDGYVDINEAYAVVGKILFPLDADISGQERGSSLWPAGDIYGSYQWERATSYSRFISDLREPDLNEENDFAKLGPNGDLNLDGRVVMVHGTNALSNLPDTVGTHGRLSNIQVMPIACGVIRKVTTFPGQVLDDPSLGVATGAGETVGGSSGADDGAIVPVDGVSHPEEDPETPDTTTGGTSGGTTGDTGTSGGSPREHDHHTSTSGGTAGGSTAGGSTSGGTTGDTTGGATSGGVTGGSTTGGTTGAAPLNYGDDDDDGPHPVTI